MSNQTEEFNWKTLTDFNWKTYIELNEDLKDMTKSQAKHHFYNVGIKEKRKYKRENILENFDAKAYIELNDDLKNMRKLQAKNHFNKFGIKEKRKYKYENIPEDFDVKVYIDLNDDLKNMTEIEAKIHYENKGYKENRKYKHDTLDSTLNNGLDDTLNNGLDSTFLSYVPQCDLRHFQHTNRYVRIFQRIKNINLFDVDLNFVKQAYNLQKYSQIHMIAYIKKTNYIGHIFHPKQLYNLFNNKIKILVNEEKCIHVNYQEKNYKIHEFIQMLDNYSFDDFKNLTIRQIENCRFIGNPLLLLFFIGSETNIACMFEKIKNYYTIQPFSLAFCVNNNKLDIILPLIKSHFNNNFIVYSCNEMGNDIVPSLLAYNEIIKYYNFDYIIKIHTKTNVDFLNKATDYLFNKDLTELLSNKNVNSSSIGFEYKTRINDIFNTKLCSKFSNILIHNEFVTGTMFLTSKNVMDKVFIFFKENHKVLFFQNTYDNNSFNRDYSYVHFLERLFGYL